MDKIITITSKTGSQTISVKRTGAGITITQQSNKGGGKKTIHIFEECVPGLIDAFRDLGVKQ